MNKSTLEIMKKVETLNTKDLRDVLTWVEFTLSKRDDSGSMNITTNAMIETLVDKAMKSDRLEEFVDGVRRNMILPGFEEALIRHLYDNATTDSRRSAIRLLEQQ